MSEQAFVTAGVPEALLSQTPLVLVSILRLVITAARSKNAFWLHLILLLRALTQHSSLVLPVVGPACSMALQILSKESPVSSTFCSNVATLAGYYASLDIKTEFSFYEYYIIQNFFFENVQMIVLIKVFMKSYLLNL